MTLSSSSMTPASISSPSFLLTGFFLLLACAPNGQAWVLKQPHHQQQRHLQPSSWISPTQQAFAPSWTRLFLSDNNNNMDSDNEDSSGDAQGEALAAEFFQMAQAKGIGLDQDELLELEDEDDEDEEDDDEEDEPEPNIPRGAVNAFLGYDVGIDSKDDAMAGNVSLTNDQLYSEVKERVLDTAGGFVDYVQGMKNDENEDEDDMEDDDEDDVGLSSTRAYQPPETIPDSELTAGEVVLLVLEALRNNDIPSQNRGVEILFGFSSPTSTIQTTDASLTPEEYAQFWKETEYKVLFLQEYTATIEKADYSTNGLKAFMTARLASKTLPNQTVNVNFILSSCRTAEIGTSNIFAQAPPPSPTADDSCWLIDSILIRPESMRRRRRR